MTKKQNKQQKKSISTVKRFFYCLSVLFLFTPIYSLAQGGEQKEIYNSLTQFWTEIVEHLVRILGSSLGYIFFMATDDLRHQVYLVTLYVWVRDIVNMSFILGLVAVGLLLLIRGEGISSYNIKKIIPRFLGSAILVNFGLILLQLVTDFGNVLTKVLFFKLQAIAESKFIGVINLDLGLKIVGTLFGFNEYTLVYKEVVFGSASSIAELSLATLSLMFGVSFLYIRSLLLFLCIVLAPVAFLLWFIPATSKITQKWFMLFVSMVFVGPIAVFILLFVADISVRLQNSGYSSMAFLFACTAFMTLPCIPFILSILGRTVETEWLQNITDKISKTSMLQNMQSLPISLDSGIGQPSKPILDASRPFTQETSQTLLATLADTASGIQSKLKQAANGFGKRISLPTRTGEQSVSLGDVTIQTPQVTLQQIGGQVQLAKAQGMDRSGVSPMQPMPVFVTHIPEPRPFKELLVELEADRAIRKDEFKNIFESGEIKKLLPNQLKTLFRSGDQEQKDQMLASVDKKSFWDASQKGTLITLAAEEHLKNLEKQGKVDWDGVPTNVITPGTPLPDQPEQVKIAIKSGQFKSMGVKDLGNYYDRVGTKVKDLLLLSLNSKDVAGQEVWNNEQKDALRELAAQDRIDQAKERFEKVEAGARKKDQALETTGHMVTLAGLTDILAQGKPLPVAGDVKASIMAGNLKGLELVQLEALYNKGNSKIKQVLLNSLDTNGVDGKSLWTEEQQQKIIDVQMQQAGQHTKESTGIDEKTLSNPEIFKEKLYARMIPINKETIGAFYDQVEQPIREILVQSLDARATDGKDLWSTDERARLEQHIKNNKPSGEDQVFEMFTEKGSLEDQVAVKQILQNPALQQMNFPELEQQYASLSTAGKPLFLASLQDPSVAEAMSDRIKIGIRRIASLERLQEAKQAVGTIDGVQLTGALLDAFDNRAIVFSENERKAISEGQFSQLTPETMEKITKQGDERLKNVLLSSIDGKDTKGADIWQLGQKNHLAELAGADKIEQAKKLIEPQKIDQNKIQPEVKVERAEKDATSAQEVILADSSEEDIVQDQAPEMDEMIEAGRKLLNTDLTDIENLDEETVKLAENLLSLNIREPQQFASFPFSQNDLVNIAQKIQVYASKKKDYKPPLFVINFGDHRNQRELHLQHILRKGAEPASGAVERTAREARKRSGPIKSNVQDKKTLQQAVEVSVR